MGSKKIIFLGSSVTLGDNGWSMCEYLNEYTDYTAVKNAYNGTTLADVLPNSYVCRFKELAVSENECDCFICQLSTNDAAKNLPLGSISDTKNIESFDVTTIIGAMEYIIASAKDKWNCPVMFYTGTYMEKPAYQNMVDALYELSKKWDIGIIDLWNNPQMRSVSEDDYKKYMKDPVHPSKLGYTKWWGPEFEKALDTVIK